MKRRKITNLRIERMKKDQTQKQVAEYIGVSRQYLMMLELSQERPSDKRAQQLEEYFEKDIGYLLSAVE